MPPEPRRCLICQSLPYASDEQKDDLIRWQQSKIDELSNRLIHPSERGVLEARIRDLESTVRRVNQTIEANNETIRQLRTRRVG